MYYNLLFIPHCNLGLAKKTFRFASVQCHSLAQEMWKLDTQENNSELTTRMAAKLPSAWTNARGVSSRRGDWGEGGGGGVARARVFRSLHSPCAK